MAKARLVQLRVPEELIRRIDKYVAEGLYRSRSDVLIDATRRFLERSAPTSTIELFIDSYMRGAVNPSKEASQNLAGMFKKLRTDTGWQKQFGHTPEEVMSRLPSRLIYLETDIFAIDRPFYNDFHYKTNSLFLENAPENRTSIYNLLELC